LFQVKEVKSNSDWKEFIQLPYSLHVRDKNWVAPLRMSVRDTLSVKKNPFWKNKKRKAWMVWNDHTPVGRILALTDAEYDSRNNDKYGFFGYPEAINDQEVFDHLFDACMKWFAIEGAKIIVGPLNPSTNYELGILIDGFNSPPYFMMTHNPAYYDEMIRRCGFNKARDFFAYLINEQTYDQQRLERVKAKLALRKNVYVRKGNRKNFLNELKILHQIYNDAFKEHWGFFPMKWEEFQFMGKDMATILDDDLMLIAECDGEPAGFIFALPNINSLLIQSRSGKLFPKNVINLLFKRKKISSARILTVAVKKKFRHWGLGSYLFSEMAGNLRKNHYTDVEMSWVVEDNIQMNKAARSVGGNPYKTYRVYQKEISAMVD